MTERLSLSFSQQPGGKCTEATLHLSSNRGDHVGGAKRTGRKDLAIHWKESIRGNGLWGLSCFGREVKTRTWSIV